MNAVKEKAYAKINLYLDVTEKREDGFHEIKTVMHTVSLADDITVFSEPTRGASQVRISIDGAAFLPTDGRNLAVKAAKLFLERAGLLANINIKMKKNIPVAAGLAGGSSDAAAVLRAMNKLFGKPFGEKAMLSLSAELGSDVPYCLLGKTALCEGRGEIMTRLPDLKGAHFLIVKIAEHISTPMAYAELDRVYGDFAEPHVPSAPLDELIASLKCGAFDTATLYNVFESAVFGLVPMARVAKERLLELGAKNAMMSGSGPTVFGIFLTNADAERAAEALSREGFESFVAVSV